MLPLGTPIPASDAHAISVSLPTWSTTLGWGNRDPAILSQLSSGYPRFFIHPSITALALLISPSSPALLFPNLPSAQRCLDFLTTGRIHILAPNAGALKQWGSVFVVAYEEVDKDRARMFWQHTGEGVSTRQCEVWREMWELGMLHPVSEGDEGDDTAPPPPPPPPLSPAEQEILEKMKISEGEEAKQKILADIAGLYTTPSTSVKETSVFLYPSGMAAICAVHRILSSRCCEKSIVFGFGYTDTLKVLEKWGPGCVFYGHGRDEDLDDLERRMEGGERFNALWCEIPSNPLLITPDLARIRRLADTYSFPVVIDDTLATPINVDVLPYADIIVTSLSKAYSGKCNVMAGSIVLPPTSTLHATFTSAFTSTLFPPDALVLLHNSTGFPSRIVTMTRNATTLASFLSSSPLVSTVHYPSSSLARYRKPGGGGGTC